jgi:hypothetical protein
MSPIKDRLVDEYVCIMTWTTICQWSLLFIINYITIITPKYALCVTQWVCRCSLPFRYEICHYISTPITIYLNSSVYSLPIPSSLLQSMKFETSIHNIKCVDHPVRSFGCKQVIIFSSYHSSIMSLCVFRFVRCTVLIFVLHSLFPIQPIHPSQPMKYSHPSPHIIFLI